VICAEFDEEEAKRGFSSPPTGYADSVTFEVGDAMETIERYDGSFRCRAHRSLAADTPTPYRAVLPKVRPAG